MKKLSTAAALLLVGALALAGCTASPEPAPEAATDSPVAVAPVLTEKTAAPTASPGKLWADEVFSEWLSDEGVTAIHEFIWPFNLVVGIDSTEAGIITLYVSDKIKRSPEPLAGGYFPKEHLDTIAGVMMDKTGGNRPELKKIVAVSVDGQHQAEAVNYSFK